MTILDQFLGPISNTYWYNVYFKPLNRVFGHVCYLLSKERAYLSEALSKQGLAHSLELKCSPK